MDVAVFKGRSHYCHHGYPGVGSKVGKFRGLPQLVRRLQQYVIFLD